MHEIPNDVIERAWRCSETIILRRLYEKRIEGYTIDTAQEIAPAVLRAAGWPELVAERDRQYEENVNQIMKVAAHEALIADLAAGLREARTWIERITPNMPKTRNGRAQQLARIDALLAKAEDAK